MTAIGFIGTGNMGSAIARAAYRSSLADRILLTDVIREKAEALAAEINGEVPDNITAASKADYLFLAVKPQMLTDVMAEIGDIIRNRTDRLVIVSMLAGKDLKALSEYTGKLPVIRIMPNMPVSIGSGVIVYTCNHQVTEQEKNWFTRLMQPAGLIEEIDDHLVDVASGIMGCGPAFAAMFAEALADGGVACGLARDKAVRYAAAMMKGTAEMLLQTGMHPGQLKDAVCSPAGSTIQGVRKLEENSFRGAVMDAVIATVEKKF